MSRAFLNSSAAAGWMMVLAAGATGCIRVDDVASLATPEGSELAEHPRGDQRGGGGARLAAACNEGTVPSERAGACLILAGYFQEGSFGLPQDPARAARLWEGAVDILQVSCEIGEVTDCTRAASAMGMRPQPNGQSDAAADETAQWMVEYAQDGCRGGDPGGCALLGLIYERGRGVEPNEERSKGYYDQACGGGHRQSCLLLASRAEGRDAVLAYERACEVGSGFACAAAGQHHRKGAGVEPSIEKAGPLFQRGCSLGNMASCVMGAEMYAGGTAADRRRAMELSWAACREDVPDGCMLLGEVFERGDARSKAREAYRMACKLGEKKGCAAARMPEPKSQPDLGYGEEVYEIDREVPAEE